MYAGCEVRFQGSLGDSYDRFGSRRIQAKLASLNKCHMLSHESKKCHGTTWKTFCLRGRKGEGKRLEF